MSPLLEITLIVVLVALAVGLVPLFFQMRRTIQSLDAFLITAQKDLRQIAEDIHASRLRLDHLAASLQSSVDELSTFAHVVGDAGRALKGAHIRVRQTLETAAEYLGGIVGGISSVLSFFKTKPTSQELTKEQVS